MKKQITINGENKVVDFGIGYETISIERVRFGSNFVDTININIDGVIYNNAFTRYSNCSSKRGHEGKMSVTYECTKTGKRFGDNHKKLIEHLLSM